MRVFFQIPSLRKESQQFLGYYSRLAASIDIPGGSVAQPWELDAVGAGQGFLENVETFFQICRAFTAAQQQYLGPDRFEIIHLSGHLDHQL